MLSVVGEASACSTGSKAARSCCAAAPATACCCETPGPETAGPAALTPPIGGGLSAPDRPCECRPGDPAEPASKPESPSSVQRGARDRADSGEVTFHARPAVAFARIVGPTGDPPKTPLYLRNSRLLI